MKRKTSFPFVFLSFFRNFATMNNKTLQQPFDFASVPPKWPLCFSEECPCHGECLRFLAGQLAPDDLTLGLAIYPAALKKDVCPHFKEARVKRMAYGFKQLFQEVKKKDNTSLHNQVEAYLGGHSAFYRFNRGERLLNPERQEWILNLFRKYGYTGNLAFDHYCEVYDFR